MSLRMSRRKVEALEREQRQREARQSAIDKRRDAHHSRRLVNLWNNRVKRGARPSFWPTFGSVIAAGMPWLSVLCPACRQIADVDLRTIERHPDAPISSLIPQLSCRRCCPNPPFARLLELRAKRQAVLAPFSIKKGQSGEGA